MDDIVAQLERQRQKKKKEQQEDTSKPKEQNSSVHQIAKPFVFGQQHDNKSSSSIAQNFHYDPTTKRYYPKSTFNEPNGDNDICVQSVQQKIKQQQSTPFIFGSNNNNSTSLSNNDNINNKDGSPFLHKDNITDDDIRRVIHLPCLTSNIAGWYGDSIQDMKNAMSTSDTFGWIGNRDGYSFYLNYERDNTLESAINSLVSKRKSKKKNSKQQRKKQPNKSLLTNNNTNQLPMPNQTESKEEEEVPVALPCTQRTSLLLLTSMQYCSSSQKRNRINKLLGPICVARKATIVSTLSKLEDIEQRSTQDGDNDDQPTIPTYPIQSRYYSMIHPLQLPPRNPPYVYGQQTNEQTTIPYDCICKSYLEPTNSTFDVLPIYDINSSRQRTTNSLPYIATISNDSIYYRPGGTSSNAGSAFEIEMYKGPGQFRFHSVKIAPYSTSEQQMCGGIVLNTGINVQAFAITKAVPNNNQRKMVPFKDLIYDFCFTPSGTLQDPGLVAFACKGTVSFLDLGTGRPWSNYRNKGSEPICVEYRKNNGSNFAMFGHRNGGVSMIDTRSVQTQVLTSTNLNLKVDESFGSATSVQSLERDDNLVVVKGSFGACRLLDLRKAAKIVRSKERRLTDQNTLHEFTLPDSSDVDKMKSTRCTGLALDPTENVVIMPYASKKNDVNFAMWDINTARLVHTLNIPTTSIDEPPFCELSSIVTAGYEMRCNDSNDTPVTSIVEGTRGLWFKTSRKVASGTAPAEGGSIHHIRF